MYVNRAQQSERIDHCQGSSETTNGVEVNKLRVGRVERAEDRLTEKR